MSRVGPLLLYKIRFFFGPALRGRLGPLAGEESFEEQVHADGVHRGHPEAVADHRVGRGSPSLA